MWTVAWPRAWAHSEIFNSSVTHQARIIAGPADIDLEIELRFFGTSSKRERQRMDRDGDGAITNEEANEYLSRLAPQLKDAVGLMVDDRPVNVFPLYEPELDVSGDPRSQSSSHSLRVAYFARTPKWLRAGSLIVFEERLWQQVPALCLLSAKGQDGVQLEAARTTDSFFPANAARLFRARCRASSREINPFTALARISHTNSTATPESSLWTALCSVGLLDVLHEYACGGLGRSALSSRPFRRFATIWCEQCGLEVGNRSVPERDAAHRVPSFWWISLIIFAAAFLGVTFHNVTPWARRVLNQWPKYSFLTGGLFTLGLLAWGLGSSLTEEASGSLSEAAELAGTLLQRHPYLLDEKGQARLDEIHRELREAKALEEKSESPEAKAGAEGKRREAEGRLLNLLNSHPSVIHVEVSGDRAIRSSVQPVELPGDVGGLLLRVKSGPGDTRFVTSSTNLTQSLPMQSDPTQLIEVEIGPAGITWVLIDLADMPPGLTSLVILLQRPNGKAAALPLDVKAPETGRLKVTILPDEPAPPVPAMVRLIWKSNGRGRRPSNALNLSVPLGDYRGWDFGAAPLGPGTGRLHANLPGPLRGYYWCVPGPFDMPLSPGEWKITIRRGLEYVPIFDTFVITPGQTLKKTYQLRSWVDMRKIGWYSGDDHAHSQILSETDAKKLMTWARAEGVYVTNILKMGDIYRTWFQQRGFGKEYRLRDGDHILVPGQECPRTDVLGHFIGLNITRMVRDPNQYYLYDRVYDDIHAQGGLAGHAHGFLGIDGAYVERDLSLNVPKGKSDFLEVLHGMRLGTKLFYDFLNLGFRITASGGSDAPWVRTIGEARTYAYIGEQPFTADGWFQALRQGHTFVTNGPMVELHVSDAMPGDEILLRENRKLRVRARAWGDPERPGCAPEKLEIISQGEVIQTATASQPRQGRLSLDFEIESGDGFWIAARASGEYGTWAHTTPVYVVRRGLRFWKHGAVHDLVTKRLDSLREIEQRVTEARQSEDPGKAPRQSPALQQLVAQGPGLLQRVKEARQSYQELLETARREAPVRAR